MVFNYNGKEIKAENCKTYMDIANIISKKHNFIVCEVNGKIFDLMHEISEEGEINFFSFDSTIGQEVFWHTSSHILAQAIKRLFPDALYTIGPAIEKGFYYDFDMGDYHFRPDDVERIEKEVFSIIEENYPIQRIELSKKKAIDVFKNNSYKIEIINQLPEDSVISCYKQGEFIDLCRGPHLPSTGYVKAFKVMSFAGAYWRGDSKNKMLQRVYGISFPDEKQLKKYLTLLEEAKKRDHRLIGKELDLFSFHDEGPGFPFWHNNGMIIFKTLVDYIRGENAKRGYLEVMTPPILSDVLWKRSGHWDNYKNNMYFTEIDEKSYAVKPMNCPGGLLIYKTRLHSYRELPIKQAEFGLVHRHELSGVLHGLFRVRSFTQDDAHIFCTEDQLTEQIIEIVNYTMEVYKVMGFKEFDIFVATRPDKFIGTLENWNKATEALTDSLEKLGISYKIKDKEGAFYGPKIEFNIKDSLERNWQCGTVQVDFSMPEKFDLTYEASDGTSKRPVMVHRAILGSLERFIGILIEHYSGKLPVWLSPIQVRLINVSDSHLDYLNNLYNKLNSVGIRVDKDIRNETLGYKVREARNKRIPYIIVIGDKEVNEKSIAVRDRSNNSVSMSVESFINIIKEKIESKAIE
ncbi:MAG TPA: threonine--tRNA ligase [Spirochaetota bacterium]|nr:threonine--tRNA ligase [Spirochaetota bacterium]HOM37688.1 threonine--tRNA ligase [Spirochaetota bacterium]HPQ49646.1 threonine--tRNA ligase [Spirochaetota bacterium]